jgi:hypothetical protein
VLGHLHSLFNMLPPRAYLFLALNAVRVLSLIALLLVFSSNITVIVSDIKAVNRFQQQSQQPPPPLNSTTATTPTPILITCDYIAFVHSSSFIPIFIFLTFTYIAEAQSPTNPQASSGQSSTDSSSSSKPSSSSSQSSAGLPPSSTTTSQSSVPPSASAP